MYRMTMLAGLLVAIMGVSAFGAGIIGTPTAELEQGQWNVGFNYSYIDTGLDKTKLDASVDSVTKIKDKNGLFSARIKTGLEGELGKLEIDDVITQRYYGTIGYGLTDSWEVYVQLGIADLKAKMRMSERYDDADDEDAPEWAGLNFDNDFAWGWGTRYTFYEQDNVRWGASVQMNWLDTSWDVKDSESYDGSIFGVGYEVEGQSQTQIDWSTYDLLIAAGPTVDMGGWNLYGGPFYYMQKGDMDWVVNETYSWSADTVDVPLVGVIDLEGSGVENAKISGDLEVDSFGGFVGVQCELMEKYSMTAELAFTGDGWAIGAGVALPF